MKSISFGTSFGARILAGALLASAVAHASVLATLTSQITATTPTQLGRLSRNSLAQDWSGSETFPGVINTTLLYHYETFVVNVGTASFIQIDVDDPGAGTFASAYDTAYLPDSAGSPNFGFNTNWLGDGGISGNPAPGDPLFFQVIIPANHDLVVVMNDPNAGTLGLNDPFTLTVEGFSDSSFDPPIVTPEPSTVLIGGGSLLLLAVLARYRKMNQFLSGTISM